MSKTYFSLCAHSFCTQICYYCDFSKVFIQNQPVDAYLKALIQEFDSYGIRDLKPFILEEVRLQLSLLNSWSIS